jgi:hypothetical protein
MPNNSCGSIVLPQSLVLGLRIVIVDNISNNSATLSSLVQTSEFFIGQFPPVPYLFIEVANNTLENNENKVNELAKSIL